MKRVLLRIFHFVQRMFAAAKRIPKNTREFGFKIAGYIFIDAVVPPGKTEKYINTIYQYVNEFEKTLVEQYRKERYIPNAEMKHSFAKVPVWCCWWQGEENMPEVVAMCHSRLKQVIPDNAELHMITKNNWREYINLPQHIIEKFEAKKITVTTLSDIIRMSLLSSYGGLWMDATVFVSCDSLPEEFISKDYFAQSMYDPVKHQKEACKGRWCGFLMSGSQNNIMFRFVRDAFFLWWKEHNDIIDYVLIDYLILVAYENLLPVKEMIDALPSNNVDIFDMYQVLNCPYSDELWSQLTATTVMHKLTYKMDLVKKTKDGQETLYQHMLKQVNS